MPFLMLGIIAAHSAEIAGFGNLRFGMSVEQARRALTDFAFLNSITAAGGPSKFDQTLVYEGKVSGKEAYIKVFFVKSRLVEINVFLKATPFASEDACFGAFDDVYGHMKLRYGQPDVEPKEEREGLSSSVGRVISIEKRARFTAKGGAYAELEASVMAVERPDKSSFSCTVAVAYLPAAEGPTF